MEKLLLARDSNRVITEINHVEHAWELHISCTQTYTYICIVHVRVCVCVSVKNGQEWESKTSKDYHGKHSLSE